MERSDGVVQALRLVGVAGQPNQAPAPDLGDAYQSVFA